jgi:hypothetical protein
MTMLRIEIEREDDGCWLGEIPELPGTMAYGATEAEARANTIALAFRVIGEPYEFTACAWVVSAGDGRMGHRSSKPRADTAA